MLREVYKSLVILVIIAASQLVNGIGVAAQEEASVEYKKFKKVGVTIPIRNYEREESNMLIIEINKKDVSIINYIWSSIWGKDFGYYMEGANLEDKNKVCPFVGEETKLPGSKIESIGNGKHRVTMVLPPDVIDSIITNRCAISPKPRKSPKVSEIKKPEKTSRELFPTVQ